MSILSLFGLERRSEGRDGSSAETETVRKIVDQLDHMEPDRARFVAAYAFVLSRVAQADMNISPEETRTMERLVSTHGGLGEEQAIIVVQMAKNQNLLFGGTENFLVTRELNRIATREQKLALLDCLFGVSAADDTITAVEDNVVRQIADELLLEHSDYIAARSKYRDQLGVLKKRADDPGQTAE